VSRDLALRLDATLRLDRELLLVGAVGIPAPLALAELVRLDTSLPASGAGGRRRRRRAAPAASSSLGDPRARWSGLAAAPHGRPRPPAKNPRETRLAIASPGAMATLPSAARAPAAPLPACSSSGRCASGTPSPAASTDTTHALELGGRDRDVFHVYHAIELQIPWRELARPGVRPVSRTFIGTRA
jgi:hypothetical protein